MERLKVLARLAVWLIGLAYAVMWAVTGPLERTFALQVHPETLPFPLHVIGLPSAAIVLTWLAAIALRRGRPAEAADRPAPRPRFRRPDPTVQRIKARDHFGLRGLQH
jgi:hypothetical protein